MTCQQVSTSLVRNPQGCVEGEGEESLPGAYNEERFTFPKPFWCGEGVTFLGSFLLRGGHFPRHLYP